MARALRGRNNCKKAYFARIFAANIVHINTPLIEPGIVSAIIYKRRAR
jgi:hypothetical protein